MSFVRANAKNPKLESFPIGLCYRVIQILRFFVLNPTLYNILFTMKSKSIINISTDFKNTILNR